MASELVTGALSWLQGAARGFCKKYPHGLLYEELYAEGWLMLVKLEPRYDPERGATFATFCAPYVIRRWSRLRAKQVREIPVGGWIEMVGSMKDEGAMRCPDEDDRARARGMVDGLLMASALTVAAEDDRQDYAKFIRFMHGLPALQKDLLLGLFRDGKTQAELLLQLGLTRGIARSQIQQGMEALSAYAWMDRGRAS